MNRRNKKLRRFRQQLRDGHVPLMIMVHKFVDAWPLYVPKVQIMFRVESSVANLAPVVRSLEAARWATREAAPAWDGRGAA